ncbi:hypothetical protein P691DRAFT_768865 [Macrolepiota fuliginosa MF-IS2]|uniref:Uncharacterized protein n=1 Tax=Macrolepiota fuliginosa MF-IS2 TaxID=1400762 RepID=A0A9P6BVQ6_9AGAR|nr:hypothetical protein P691DRAFT_768865 [Macrolepiota fuliginosa MF-IS2]
MDSSTHLVAKKHTFSNLTLPQNFHNLTTNYDTDPNPDYDADYNRDSDSDISDYDTDIHPYDPTFNNCFNEIYSPDFNDDYHIKDLAPSLSNCISIKQIPCCDHTNILCPKKIQCFSINVSSSP